MAVAEEDGGDTSGGDVVGIAIIGEISTKTKKRVAEGHVVVYGRRVEVWRKIAVLGRG